MSIVEFLEARIAEDEAVARRATPGPWRYNPGKVWYTDEAKLARARSGNPFVTGGEEFVGAGPDDGSNETTLGIAATGPENNGESMSNAAHIANWDPARVLAECAAKRAIIAEHGWRTCANAYDEDVLACETCGAGDYPYYTEWPCPTIRALASVYASHPDYSPDWA